MLYSEIVGTVLLNHKNLTFSREQGTVMGCEETELLADEAADGVQELDSQELCLKVLLEVYGCWLSFAGPSSVMTILK